ncbi:MAG TPA: hypothetical protein VKV15_13465, partial [Bryobacteraceae bacterium]|nr:hypothetical protein [Bryobacteraceae bacterium]
MRQAPMAVVSLFFAASFAFAQNVSSVIVGAVKDATGSAIPSAVVTVSNEGTNREIKLTTS